MPERRRVSIDPTYDLEARAACNGALAGVDEVGRGALAGPVVAAAVVLPPDADLPGITDSKKMSRSRRNEGYALIVEQALAWSIGLVEPEVVDRINIRQATLQAMRTAVSALCEAPDLVLVDGRDDPGLDADVRTVIAGDSISLSIAAASVLAKVTRDRMMVELAREYPDYGFERHVGYGTSFHREAILRHGPAPPHRRTFLGSLLQRQLEL